jgi:crotonobetainyl-CoA:carnitine CoA-transferase CaiB-like acyl-CoA transferase
MAPPLEGIMVLDLSRVAPGAYCAMLLGDLGADVLKVEQPHKPGLLGSGLSPIGEGAEREAAYNALNRNKRSIVLNLKSAEAKEIFLKLAQRADVVLEGFRPGVVKRLGVNYDTVKERNPKIVYCSLTGYGQDGPYRDMPGHDLNYVSIPGILSLIGRRDGSPTIPGNLMADYAGGGMHAALGILAALMARERTGKGQFVDIAMADGVLSMMSREFSMYLSSGVLPKRGETLLTGAAPDYNVYESQDGKYISVACLEPRFWENLCKILGREDLIAYQRNEEKKDEIFSAFSDIFRTRTRDEWLEILEQTDVCVAPVNTLDEVLADPQVLHRRMVVDIDSPTVGKVKQVGISVKLSETPGEIRSLAPFLGQHTEEVLTDLGYSMDRIAEMRDKKVIQ